MTNNISKYHPLSIIALLMLFFTTLGTAQLVKDINVGPAGSQPYSFVALGNKAYFIAIAGTSNQIFQTDGTTNGTTPVTGFTGDILLYSKLVSWNSQAYFVTKSEDPTRGTRILLYKTSGATAVFVDTLISNSTSPSLLSFDVFNLHVENNLLYYDLQTISYRSLVKTLVSHNGQRNGSKVITGIGGNTSTDVATSSSSSNVFYGSNTFYTDERGGSSGNNSAFRTLSVVRNTTPVSKRTIFTRSWLATNSPPADFEFSPMGVIGDLFYAVNKDTLFRYDSTGVRTLIKTGVGVSIYSLQKLGNVMYFSNNLNQLWKTDGTAAGTVQITTNLEFVNKISNIISQNNSIYIETTAYSIVPSLYKLTGNTLTRIGSDSEGRFYNYFTYNSKLYWYYGDTFGGFKVFEEGATEAQTKTIAATGAPGSSSVTGEGAITANGLFLLALNNKVEALGVELWKFDLNIVSSTYCTSKGTLPWEFAISNVKFNTLNNTTDKFKDINSLGYSDYTSLTTTVNKGQSYPLSITPLLSWIGNLQSTYARVWIDYNQNKIFEANELVLEKANANPLTQSVLIPTTALTGTTRMRVSLKNDAYPTACETFAKGEVEDYTITIQEGIVTQLPDYTLTNFSLRVPSVVNGDIIYYTVDAKNIGTGSSGTTPVNKTYLSLDQTLDASDTQVGSANLPTLPSGQTLAGISGQASSIGFVGTYYVIVKIDPDNTIAESNENNNVIVSSTPILINPVANTCRTQDSLQLVRLYNATNGANWTNKWILTTPINTWYGVTLNTNGCVLRLELETNNLEGTLPNLNMPNLEGIFMIENKLSGTIPNFNLPNLKALFLYRNQLSGSIPNFSLMPNLQILSLFENRLNGTIPNFNLPNLGGLFLNSNQFSGIIPSFNLLKLVDLDISKNLLTGSIPTFNLPALRRLVLNNNQLSGCLPASLKSFCGIFVQIQKNPDLATQDFTAFCQNNTGACTTNQTDLRCNISFASVASNNTLTLNGNVTSRSNANVNNVSVRIYISRDSVISADDKLAWNYNTFNFGAAPIDNSQAIDFDLLPWNSGTGTFYLILVIDEPNAVVETNEFNNKSIYKLVVNPTNNSSLVLGVGLNAPVYRIYSAYNFKFTATNSGTTNLKDVEIKFTRPSQSANGGAKTVSIGSFQDFCPGGIECSVWRIPNFPAGTTATLDAPVFILAPTGNISASVSTSPSYSVGQNVSPATAPAQASAAQALTQRVPTQLIPVIIQAISPNPTEGDVQIKLDSWTKQTVDFNFSDITGKVIYSEKRDLEKGLNKLDFEVFHLPQGVYFIQTNVGKGKDVPSKFVKM
jgi:hypothetical protein